MRIGPYDVFPIETGSFALDGGAMFGVVPRALWEKTNPPDEKNRIAMEARALLLVGKGRRILVDAGNGAKYDQKLSSIYKIDTGRAEILTSLKRHNLAPADITDVILTHLHFDHAGGATTRTGGKLVPTFPNAKHYVQYEQWLSALKPTERDRASYFAEDYLPLYERGLLQFTEGEMEVVPGIRVRCLHGHTAALQCPIISDGDTTLFYCADLVPTASHVQLPWIMAYDLRPLVTLEEKRRLLREAVDQKWILFFEHDPAIPAARVKEGDKGFAAGNAVKLE